MTMQNTFKEITAEVLACIVVVKKKCKEIKA